VLVSITIGFELAQELANEGFNKYSIVLDHIWAEFTVLGFLAAVTFVLVQAGGIQMMSMLIYHDPEHLLHLFEKIHFALFFVMILFLVCALWILVAASNLEAQWDEYEKVIFKHVQATLLAGEEPDGGFDLCETMRVAAAKRSPPWKKVALMTGSATAWAHEDAKARCVFQRLRERFLHYMRTVEKTAMTTDFEFSDYLLECIKETLAHSMHLGVTTWLRSITVMTIIFSVAAFAPNYAVGCMVASGWFMWVQSSLVLEHYRWAEAQLIPVTQTKHDEIKPLVHPESGWTYIYTKFFRPAKGGFDPKAPPQMLGGFYPGAFSRVPFTQRMVDLGLSKQSAMVWPTADKPHGRSAEAIRHSVLAPIQTWLQANLLISALYMTVGTLFYAPDSKWDWKVALGVFPIFASLIFQVPDCLAPMTLLTSVELLSCKHHVQKINERMKLVKFACTAKVRQAMTAQMASLAFTTAGSFGTGAKTFKEMLSKLDQHKKARALELKECFDAFDTSGDGFLDVGELEAMFTTMGLAYEEHQMTQILKVLDADSSGDVSFLEFAEYMLHKEGDHLEPEEAAEKIFEMIDTDGGGVLDTVEMKEAFEKMHTGLTLNELTQVMLLFDQDGTGKVEKPEFIEVLKQIFEDANQLSASKRHA